MYVMFVCLEMLGSDTRTSHFNWSKCDSERGKGSFSCLKLGLSYF